MALPISAIPIEARRSEKDELLQELREKWDGQMSEVQRLSHEGEKDFADLEVNELFKTDREIRTAVRDDPPPKEPSYRAAPSGGAMAETDDRLKCFLLGARIHDHVDDMVWAVHEIAEAKPGDGTGLGADATRIFDTLRVTTAGEIDKAVADGCVRADDPVAQQWRAVLEAGVTQGFSEVGEAVRALAATLGDPPLLRNVRRYVETRPSRPEERK